VHNVPLPALDGANPLALFAALGVLRAISARTADARLLWYYSGTWQPVVQSDVADLNRVIEVLDADRRECASDAALTLEYQAKRDLKPRPCDYRMFLDRLASMATSKARRSVDWASAFASDVVQDNNGNTKPTAFHFTAGQQQFLQMIRELVTRVSQDDLREALEGPWTYRSPLPVMGWDATSSRDYALRASDPSTDKKLGVPGADWLAFRGLALFPTAPNGKSLLTTGCTGGWKSGSFSWPLWTVPLRADVIHSVIGQNWAATAAVERSARGIAIVFKSAIRRSDQGGYGSFGPATVM
jgi:hypothetical protein